MPVDLHLYLRIEPAPSLFSPVEKSTTLRDRVEAAPDTCFRATHGSRLQILSAGWPRYDWRVTFARREPIRWPLRSTSAVAR
jgi:hypothetical protein